MWIDSMEHVQDDPIFFCTVIGQKNRDDTNRKRERDKRGTSSKRGPMSWTGLQLFDILSYPLGQLDAQIIQFLNNPQVTKTYLVNCKIIIHMVDWKSSCRTPMTLNPGFTSPAAHEIQNHIQDSPNLPKRPSKIKHPGMFCPSRCQNSKLLVNFALWCLL